MTNNTSKAPWAVELSQIFALNDMGRTPSIPPGEAVRLAGMKSGGWTAPFAANATLGGTIGGVIGGGIGGMVGGIRDGTSGATIGVVVGAAGGGAIGAAIAGVWGWIEGSKRYPAGAKDNSDYNQQLNLLALSESKEAKLYNGFTVSGYVYFPAQEDQEVERRYRRVEVMIAQTTDKGVITTQSVEANLDKCPKPDRES